MTEELLQEIIENALGSRLNPPEEFLNVNVNFLSEGGNNTNEEKQYSDNIKHPPFLDKDKTIQLQGDFTSALTTRFSDAHWFDVVKNLNIVVAGVGGIGSWTSLLLSRMFPKSLSLIDSDIVNGVNMAGQFYTFKSVDNYKVNELRDSIYLYSDMYNVNTYTEKLDKNTIILKDSILICGFDNMGARKTAFTLFKDAIKEEKGFTLIDARLAAEYWQVFVLSPHSSEEWISTYEKEWLFSDEEANQENCSYKQTSYAACMLASYISNIVVNMASNMLDGFRSVPSVITYDAYTMTLDFKNYD